MRTLCDYDNNGIPILIIRAEDAADLEFLKKFNGSELRQHAEYNSVTGQSLMDKEAYSLRRVIL